MLIKTNWYVITGTISSGKTKIINYLAFLGYCVVPEAARILIDDELSRGKTIEEIRSSDLEFQRKVLQMKVEKEETIFAERLTFFDRGIPDSIPYYQLLGEAWDFVIHASKRKYRGVFLLDPIPFETDYARTEDGKTASTLDELLYATYSNLGYDIIRVPKMPIRERSEFVLRHVPETF